MKKIPETDLIFKNVKTMNQNSDTDPKSLRISIDCKAKVKIGNLSRGGKSRLKTANKASDHDMSWQCTLAPFGIQDMSNRELSLFFGTSHETSDFVVDCLEAWWEGNKEKNKTYEELVINLDNGPSQKSVRTQFIKRMVLFTQKINIPVHLVYYPPYHSKYNPIEHTFGVLERYWNGAILDTTEKALGLASKMVLKGKNPTVELIDKAYQKGVALTKKELKPFLQFISRSDELKYWDVIITPQSGMF